MSSELHKYIENAIEKKANLFNAEVLDFPVDKKKKLKNSQLNIKNYWNISEQNNNDQLKAVTGICFMLGFLLVMGLFANLTAI
tara:strand:- start:205 stop:453 length:249 start_codon:yes stop_codon:yes gene_type:complete